MEKDMDWMIAKEKEISRQAEIDIVRLMLVKNIGWFIVEWQNRHFGADRSDLVKKLATHLVDGSDDETHIIQTPIRSKNGFEINIEILPQKDDINGERFPHKEYSIKPKEY